MSEKHTFEVNGIVAICTQNGRIEVFKRNTSDLLILDESQLEDASLVLGMAADANRASTDERWQFAESRMIYWAAEHGRLFDIVHGTTPDKSNRDYHERVKRNAEFCAHATTELRRLLEMFKPPDYVIDVKRDHPVGGRWDRDKDGKFYQHADRVWPFVVTLRDARLHTDRHEEASDAHIFTTGETEGAAYASLLETILAGRGFFPGT